MKISLIEFCNTQEISIEEYFSQLEKYLADYINDELDRKNKITYATIQEGIEAFEGGASYG